MSWLISSRSTILIDHHCHLHLMSISSLSKVFADKIPSKRKHNKPSMQSKFGRND